MNKNFHITCFVILFALLPRFGNSADLGKISNASDSARITIISNPSGVVVKLDEKFIGVTPIKNFPCTGGTHKIWAINPDRTNILAIDWLKTFDIQSGQQLTFHIDFNEMYQKAIKLAKDSQFNSFYPLKNMVPAKTSGTFTKLTQSSLKPQPKSKRLTQYLMISSIGATILSGLTSVHYHDKANYYYHQYLKSGNPQQMDNYFDKSQHYDRLAGISYGAFQINFLAAVYFFIKSR